MMVCQEIQDRIDKVWSDLQKLLFVEGISQIDLDNECAQWLEESVKADKEAFQDNETVGGDIIIRTDGLDGPSFRCDCGCNVFRKTVSGKYKCNSCGELYEGKDK